jgi:hypothetical protein
MKNGTRRPGTSESRLDDSVNKQAKAVKGAMIDAIIMAAEEVGENGKGKDGLVGYFRSVARSHPQLFLRLLVQAELQIEKKPDDPLERSYETVEEAKEALRKEGISIDC